jgi:predicted ATPase
LASPQNQRAITSLTRLWQQQGKAAEARDVLALVYNWFTEGFDTQDLQEAKALPSTLDKKRTAH